jgi:hypothetical protein
MVSVIERLASFYKQDIAYQRVRYILEQGVTEAGQNFVTYGKQKSTNEHKIRIAESHLWCLLLSLSLTIVEDYLKGMPVSDSSAVESLIVSCSSEDEREPL